MGEEKEVRLGRRNGGGPKNAILNLEEYRAMEEGEREWRKTEQWRKGMCRGMSQWNRTQQ